MEEEREASLEKSEFWRESRGGGLEDDEKEAREEDAGAREGAASSSEAVPSVAKT